MTAPDADPGGGAGGAGAGGTRAPWPEALADLRAPLDARFRAIPFAALLGIELDDWGPGWSRVRLTPSPAVHNLVGTVHGGAIATLADVAFEVACNAHGRESVALDLSAHFTAPAGADPLVAEADEVTRSRRTASYRITVTQGTTTVAWFLAVAYRTARWHLGEDRYPLAWREAH